MFSNFSGWSAKARGIARDNSGGKGQGKSRDHEKDRDDYQWGHSKSRGHEKDRDDVFDHGHDAHGNGNGFGHDKHGTEEPPPGPEPECTDVDENQTLVFDLDSAGELNGGTGDTGVVYAIAGGADAALFEVDASTGGLVFINAPDFETPLSADGDNSYDVVVRAIDVGNPCKFVDETFQVCVQDVDETPPPGPNAGPQISPIGPVVPINVGSRGKIVADIDAIDPDDGPQPITYSISGEDADFFEFNTATGEITAPADVQLFEVVENGDDRNIRPIAESADGDFTFEVTVTASDGLDTDSIDLQMPLFIGG